MATSALEDPSAVPAPLAAGSTLAAYVLTGRILGRGGFGTVYEARHAQLDRLVAIKVQGEANVRLLDEARLIAKLRHPNIVDVFDVGALADGRVYFVMELLEGATLEQHLAIHPRLALGAALPILHELARALDAIHAKGFAHRDVKPSNVMLLRDEDGSLRVKLLDFGIAKALSEQRSGNMASEAKLIGTPAYMSPEQCLLDPVGPASDIYSLGVVTYRMLTGRRPFDGNAVDVYHAHVHTAPPLPSLTGIDAQTDAPILAMLAKSPAARPRSAIAAIAAIGPAERELATQRSDAAVSRPRRLAIAVGAVVVVVAVAAAIAVNLGANTPLTTHTVPMTTTPLDAAPHEVAAVDASVAAPTATVRPHPARSVDRARSIKTDTTKKDALEEPSYVGSSGQ